MIKDTRLSSLVDQHKDLANEVGILGSDMQTLVYENYSKFITATDIIRHLDTSMCGLDTRLHQLQDLIDSVAVTSERVNSTLEQRQDTIVDMTQTRKMLHQLEAIMEIPQRLRAAVKSKAYDLAIDIYASAAPVLVHHGNRNALQKTRDETEEIKHEIADYLRQQLHSDPTNAAETISLISSLGEPIESLQDEFLQCQQRRIQEILDDAVSYNNNTGTPEIGITRGSSVGSRNSTSTTTNTNYNSSGALLHSVDKKTLAIQSAAAALTTQFITEVTRTVDLFQDLFDPGSRPRLIAECKEWLFKYLCVVKDLLMLLALHYIAASIGLDAETGEIAAAAASGFGDETERAVLHAVNHPTRDGPSNRNSRAPEDGVPSGAAKDAHEVGPHRIDYEDEDDDNATTITTGHGVVVLIDMLREIKQQLVGMDKILPEISAKDKASELIGNCLRQHIALSFLGLEAKVAVQLQHFHDAYQNPERMSRGSGGDGGGGGSLDDSMTDVHTNDSYTANNHNNNTNSNNIQTSILSDIRSMAMAMLLAFDILLQDLSLWMDPLWISESFTEVYNTTIQAHVHSWMHNVPQRCIDVVQKKERNKDSDDNDEDEMVPPFVSMRVGGRVPFASAWKRKYISSHAAAPALGSSTEVEGAVAPMCALALCVLCSFMSSTLSRSVQVSMETLQRRGNRKIHGSHRDNDEREEEREEKDIHRMDMDTGNVAREAAMTVLGAYMRSHEACVSSMMRQSVQNTAWAQHGAAIAPRPICVEFLRVLASVDHELGLAEHAAQLVDSNVVSTLTPEGGHGSRDDVALYSMHSRHSTGGSSLELLPSTSSSMQHHFSVVAMKSSTDAFLPHRTGSAMAPALTRSDLRPSMLIAPTARALSNGERHSCSASRASPTVHGSLPWSPHHADVLSRLAVAALRSLSSWLGCETLNRGAFQQVQLDCHYMRPHIQSIVGDQGGFRGGVAASLDEVLVVAAERCQEAVLLEPSALDRLILQAGMK